MLSTHLFKPLVQFGSDRVVLPHFEVSATATYGCLLKGEKHWNVYSEGKVLDTVVQKEGNIVYLLPGCVHEVTTISKSGILVGETDFIKASVFGFAQQAANLTYR